MKTVNIYTASTIRGPRRKNGYIAYVLEYKVEMLEEPVTLTATKKLENATENQAELTAIIEALGHMQMKCNLNIYTDNDQIPAALKNGWVTSWQQAGWKNAKGKPVANQAEWQKMTELLVGNEVEWHVREHHSYRKWLLAEIKREE